MPSISAPIAAAAIGGAASLGGALISSNAAESAAQTQAQAAQAAQSTEVQATNAALAQGASYNQIGTGAANSLANLYGIPYAAISNGQSSTSPSGIVTPANINAAASSAGGSDVQNAAYANFSNTPNYQFAFNQGLQALQRSAAAGGTLISGGQLKGAQEFGQGLASQQFNNYVSGLQNLAGMGQAAAAGQANTGLAGAGAVANTQQAAGQALASGTVGSANALSSGLNGVSSSVFNSLLLSKLSGGSLNSAYNNSTGNYAGLSNAGQDAIQDNPATSYLLG
jgi:hypothetical protein